MIIPIHLYRKNQRQFPVTTKNDPEIFIIDHHSNNNFFISYHVEK